MDDDYDADGFNPVPLASTSAVLPPPGAAFVGAVQISALAAAPEPQDVAVEDPTARKKEE